jgi:hypothetical protein
MDGIIWLFLADTNCDGYLSRFGCCRDGNASCLCDSVIDGN